MKKTGTDKFDYPTATAQSYKVFRETKPTRSEAELNKKKYQQIIRQEKENERIKTQQEQQRKKQQQKKEQKARLQQQLEIKKKELEDLENARLEAIENQKKSYELAIIKQQQEELRKIEKEEKAKDDQENANRRFINAVKRLEIQKDEQSYKEKQAEHRRRVCEENQKLEREKAIRYRYYMEEEQRKNQAQEKIEFTDFKQSKGRYVYNQTVDYTKTCLRNPKLIVKNYNEDQGNDAITNAAEQAARQREKSREKEAREMDYKKRSEERGQQALLRLQREKEYAEYSRQAEHKAINFNLERVEAGKKNQYAGLKPATLSQMMENKRQRSEKEFQEMFISNPTVTGYDRIATKYQIVEKKMVSENSQNESSIAAKTDTKYARKAGSESMIPNVSDGKYSFQENNHAEDNEEEEVPRIIGAYQKNRNIETRLPYNLEDSLNAKKRPKKRELELNYSESEDSVAQ